MKEIKELKLEELSLEQKIGQLLVARKITDTSDPTNREFVYEMLEKRCVGGIQVACDENAEREIAEIKHHADYPLLICNDMERGYPCGLTIPSMLGLAITGDKELAYQVGAVTAIEAKRIGFNTAWGPVVDFTHGYAECVIPRMLGTNREDVAVLANEIMRGYNDNGLLASAKHWASPYDNVRDTHMFSAESNLTEKDLIEEIAYPYVYIMKNAGLNAVMTDHMRIPNVDPEYPCTMSEKIVGILRSLGHDGLMFTDSFAMIGVLQRYGVKKCYGQAIKAGNDMILPNYRVSYKESYEYLLEAYKEGMFSEERLNEAVCRVLKAQHLVMKEPSAKEPSPYQIECFERINRDSICVIKDESTKTALNKDTKKLFVIMTENYYLNDNGVPYEIDIGGGVNSKNINAVKESILKRFPNSEILEMCQYPSTQQIERICTAATNADEVVYITFVTTRAYQAGEHLTENAVGVIESMSNKVCAVCHLGNPFATEALPHVPRLLVSVGGGEKTVDYMMKALGGEYEPKGIMPLNLNLK